MENHTAKHFALQLGSLASLYLSLAFFLVLVFGLINLLFPDPTESSWQIDSSTSMVRLGFAMTIVFFPTYLWLTRLVNQNRRRSADGTYLGLTKWLIYLSLLVGGAVLLGDLVAIIMGFLEGELTTRFILKALAVLVVIGGALFYYSKDAQGYWLEHETFSIRYGIVVAVVIFAILAVGLSYIETPGEARELRIDEEQVSDLQEIQYNIENYLRSNERLPESISVAYEGRRIPSAPEGRSTYQYELTNNGFRLCAEFTADARAADQLQRPLPYREESANPYILNPNDWQYTAGAYCFEREVEF